MIEPVNCLYFEQFALDPAYDAVDCISIPGMASDELNEISGVPLCQDE
jgi:hypothetical protein